MESVKNLVEYYDELYPVLSAQQTFYEALIERYSRPAKFLDIGCGTGVLCHRLSKNSVDATGLETQKELLDSASLKYRSQLMSLRYFQMSTLEMTRFLGKKFYNIISCINSRIVFVHDKTLMKKFFFDCKELLSDGGTLVLQLFNFEKYKARPKCCLPQLNSARVQYKSSVQRLDGEHFALDSALEKNGKTIPVYGQAKIYPLTKSDIEAFSRKAGFSNAQFFSAFDKSPFEEKSDFLLAVMR